MPITVTSATAIDALHVNVLFGEAYVDNAIFREPSYYVISTQYGINIPVFVKSVNLISTTTIELELKDAMLQGGHYLLTIFSITGVDGIPIEQQTPYNEAQFEGVGEPYKTFTARKLVPPWYNTTYGTNVHALLCALGKVNDTITGDRADSAISELRRSILIRFALGNDLSVIGQNYGVVRPELLRFDDEKYATIIPLLWARRKTALKIFHEVLTALLGDRSLGWDLYCTKPNVVTVEADAALVAGLAPSTLADATYFHNGDSGTSSGVGLNYLDDSTKNWTPNQWTNATLRDSGSTDFTILSNTATRLVISGTPAAGAYTILMHDTASYAGDYFVLDATVAGTTVGGNTIQLFQGFSLGTILDEIKAAATQIDVTTYY